MDGTPAAAWHSTPPSTRQLKLKQSSMRSASAIVTSTASNRKVLNEVAESTGGRAFFPKKEDDLKAAFAEIERELRSQYLVAYSSTNKKQDGSFRRITIEVTNPDLRKEQLRLPYRPGYFPKKSG